MTSTRITKCAVDDNDYDAHTYMLYGDSYSMSLEPQIFHAADELSDAYGGGVWDFFALSNGGFFMSPRYETVLAVNCSSGSQVNISAEAFGISACLFAFSRLSFGYGTFAETCGRHYYLLRSYMLEQSEAALILRAID